MTPWPATIRKPTVLAYLDMHYAARVDQGRLSEAAILKMERKK